MLCIEFHYIHNQSTSGLISYFRYRGKRMRIDYFLVSEKLQNRIASCEMHGKGIELEGMLCYAFFQWGRIRWFFWDYECSSILIFIKFFVNGESYCLQVSMEVTIVPSLWSSHLQRPNWVVNVQRPNWVVNELYCSF